MPKQTPSQTVGPYFAYGLTPMGYGRPGIASHRIADDTVPGRHVVVTGRVLDGKGEPISDGMLEVWQADAQGRLAHPADGRTADFHGFGRAGTNDKGEYRFETVKPGRVVGADARPQAPHLAVIVFARGMPSHAYTRIYFSDEAEANAEDAVLNAVEPGRRQTLIATREDTPGATLYRFDVRLQGDEETVFFDA